MPGGDTTSRIARAAAWARAPHWRAQADDPASLLVVVNKQRALRPSEYRPSALRHVDGVELRDDAARALSRLLRAADRAGAPLIAHSGFRSYESQVSTYHRWVRNLGVRSADSQSARAGFSEHQTGLAVDMLPRGGSCHELGCFGRTRQAAWLAAHATEFGFVVRYGQGQEAVTGYTAEPWHLRYLGRQAAADVRASGAASLEEYLGLPAAPGY
jgi:D-alanyl-D-alanine carboxypeptidase